MSARSAYVCQIQGCNVALLVLGLAAIGLAGSQFSSIRLENYRNIDLRLLNCVHALTGAIGMYCVGHNHGSAMAKTLYCISVVIGCATAIFYGFTSYRVIEEQRILRYPVTLMREFPNEFSTGFYSNYPARIVISALLIGDGFLAALIALISIFLLSRLVTPTLPVYPIQSENQRQIMQNACKILATVGVMKLSLGIGVLALSVFVEYEHEKEAGTDKYIKIALEHISAMLAIVSGLTDILASRGRKLGQLNLTVNGLTHVKMTPAFPIMSTGC